MDKMMRIDRMYHCHKNAVILLDSKVIDFTIEVAVKGWTCALHSLISLICVHVRGFILVYLFYYFGKLSCSASIDL
jgi:hypothetical protein